jgi:hypothetical protein
VSGVTAEELNSILLYYATTAQLANKADIGSIGVSSADLAAALAGYATSAQLAAKANTSALTGYATTAQLAAKADTSALTGYATSVQLAAKADSSALTGYATSAQLAAKADTSALTGYATSAQLATKADTSALTGYATTAQLATKADASALSGYATTAQLATKADVGSGGAGGISSADLTTALTGYATNTQLLEYINRTDLLTRMGYAMPDTTTTKAEILSKLLLDTSGPVFMTFAATNATTDPYNEMILSWSLSDNSGIVGDTWIHISTVSNLSASAVMAAGIKVHTVDGTYGTKSGTHTFAGLTLNTTYYLYGVSKDTTGNQSTMATAQLTSSTRLSISDFNSASYASSSFYYQSVSDTDKYTPIHAFDGIYGWSNHAWVSGNAMTTLQWISADFTSTKTMTSIDVYVAVNSNLSWHSAPSTITVYGLVGGTYTQLATNSSITYTIPSPAVGNANMNVDGTGTRIYVTTLSLTAAASTGIKLLMTKTGGSENYIGVLDVSVHV